MTDPNRSLSDGLNAAAALYGLADSARIERTQWADGLIRSELAHGADQLDAAAREALSQSEVYGWAWVKAGAAFIDTYRMRRIAGESPIISHLCRHQTIDKEHRACIHCDCRCHRDR